MVSWDARCSFWRCRFSELTLCAVRTPNHMERPHVCAPGDSAAELNFSQTNPDTRHVLEVLLDTHPSSSARSSPWPSTSSQLFPSSQLMSQTMRNRASRLCWVLPKCGRTQSVNTISCLLFCATMFRNVRICYGLQVCIPLQNSYVKALTPKRWYLEVSPLGGN